MNPYLCSTEEERRALLKTLGHEDWDDLFACVPDALIANTFPALPERLDEFRLLNEMKRLASMNHVGDGAVSFMGGGAYEHFIPEVVPALAGRSEFVTSYTPYQPEASQGNLQVFFEYQSLICRLLNMDVSNASLYDGATSMVEAVVMVTGAARNKNRCIISDTVHPHWREVLSTYLRRLDLELVILPCDNGVLDPDDLSSALNDQCACVVVQNPNFIGCIEDMAQLAKRTHEAGSSFIAVVDPVSLALLSPPGDYGADVAVAEGQCLGMPPYFGGETLGIFTCTEKYKWKMPGRLVGLTKDNKERRGFVLTLQSREQHIRREKATSNICTNHALNALRATIYLTALGPAGLREVALTCHSNMKYARERIAGLDGYEIAFNKPTFREFAVKSKKKKAAEVIRDLAEKGIMIGPNLGRFGEQWEDMFLLCCTETRTKNEIDNLAEALDNL